MVDLLRLFAENGLELLGGLRRGRQKTDRRLLDGWGYINSDRASLELTVSPIFVKAARLQG